MNHGALDTPALVFEIFCFWVTAAREREHLSILSARSINKLKPKNSHNTDNTGNNNDSTFIVVSHSVSIDAVNAPHHAPVLALCGRSVPCSGPLSTGRRVRQELSLYSPFLQLHRFGVPIDVLLIRCRFRQI